MNNTNTSSILEQIYSTLDRKALLSELNPVDKGSYFALTCPECRIDEAFIYKNGITIACNRLSNCGISISLWDYVQGKGHA